MDFDWSTIIGSVLGGLIGGLFTFLGVKITIKHDDKKKHEEELKRINDERPRLEIVSFKENQPYVASTKSDLDVLVLRIESVNIRENTPEFIYDEKALDLNNLITFDYELKNIGLTEIDNITIGCNYQRDTMITDVNHRDPIINHRYLSYDATCRKRFIKSGDQFTLRVCYLKDKVINGALSASLSIYMEDINGRVWQQPLFAPTNETGDSNAISYKQFKDSIDTNLAENCFTGRKYW